MSAITTTLEKPCCNKNKEQSCEISTAAATELIRDKNGRVTHIKVFLFDNTFTKTGSQIPEQYGEESAKSFIDLPLIFTPSRDHNIFPDEPGLIPAGGVFFLPPTIPREKAIKASKLFSLGKAISIQKNIVGTRDAFNRNKAIIQYSAIVKLTSEEFIDFITELANNNRNIKDIPLFVSSFYIGKAKVTQSSIPGQNNNLVIYQEPVKGIHMAIVDFPAFSGDRALVSGVCSSGDDKICSNELATAAANATELNDTRKEINDKLLKFGKELYHKSENDTNMGDNPTDKNNGAPVDNKEDTENNNNKTYTQEQVDELINKKIAELQGKLESQDKDKEKEKPKESKESKDDSSKADNTTKFIVNEKGEQIPVSELLKQVDELQKDKAISDWKEKLAYLGDKKMIEKAAKWIADHDDLESKEITDFLDTFKTKLVASANQSTGNRRNRFDDLLNKNRNEEPKDNTDIGADFASANSGAEGGSGTQDNAIKQNNIRVINSVNRLVKR